MNLADFKETQVADLWEDYQKKLEKGIDKPYIIRCDYVKVHSTEYFDKEDFPADSVGRKIAGQVVPVVTSCKVAEDLWYTTVEGNDGKDYILYDAEIEVVYKLNDRCRRCRDCFYLTSSDDERYFCDCYEKNCDEVNICRELRAQFYDELADRLDLDEDIVTQVVVDNFNGVDLDELTDDEYDELIKMLLT